MSAPWRGNLRNTGTDIVVDALSIIFTVAAYYPQISLVRNASSTRGVSPYYVLFNTILSNTQLSETLLLSAYAWPTDTGPVLEQIKDGRLEGWRAVGALLGLVQVAVQWLCSVVPLMAFISTYSRSTSGSPGRSPLNLPFLHAAATVLPAVIIAFPEPWNHSWEVDIKIALITMSNHVVAPCSLLLAFLAQLREMRQQNGRSGALSVPSLVLQSLAMTILGLRWLFRLGKPAWDGSPVPIRLWYAWGFVALNYVLCAFGCAALLLCYLWIARVGVTSGGFGDRIPLLG